MFCALVALLVTETFRLDTVAAAWTGAGLVGAGALVFAGWAVVLGTGTTLNGADRVGGDLIFVGVGVALVVAGLPTFAAGVI